MNIVYQSPTMTICDDRKPLTFDEAFARLWDGRAVTLQDPPDYSAENEFDIYGREFKIVLSEITTDGIYQEQHKEKCKKMVYEYLRGYEIYE